MTEDELMQIKKRGVEALNKHKAAMLKRGIKLGQAEYTPDTASEFGPDEINLLGPQTELSHRRTIKEIAEEEGDDE